MRASLLILLILMMSRVGQAACASPTGVMGQLSWMSGSGKIQYCNGSSWIDVPNTVGASCTGTTSGTINYSTGNLNYCNGTNWINMKGSLISSCTGTTAGSFTYDTGTNKFKMCDGANWYDMTGTIVNAITISNLTAVGATTSFSASVDFTGDSNSNATLTLYYCNNTDSPGCNPQTGTAVTMVRGPTSYGATVTGLSSPNDAGDVLNLSVVATDADGVTGSPLTGTVTLGSYMKVFITSTTYNGNLGGVSGANTKCATQATAGGLSGTYKAWIGVTSGVDDPITTFTQFAGPYKLVDGTTNIAASWSDLTDGTLISTISKDESGNAVAASNAWTNVDASGIVAGSGSSTSWNCSAWASSNSGRNAITGTSSFTNFGWTNNLQQACNGTFHLYCFQQACGVTGATLSFTDVTDASTGTLVTSNISAAPYSASCGNTISISGMGSPQFQICSDVNCSTVVHAWGSASQTLASGQYVQLRLMTGSTYAKTYSVNIAVDNSTTTWNVTNTGRRVFITSTGVNGAIAGNFPYASGTCTNAATAAGLGSGPWVPWFAGRSDSYGELFDDAPAFALGHFNVPYVDVTSTVIANDWNDLTDGTLTAAISKDQTGASVAASTHVWTNVASNGAATNSTVSSTANCSGWLTSAASPTTGNYGLTGSTTSTWTASSAEGCNVSNRLYCFENKCGVISPHNTQAKPSTLTYSEQIKATCAGTVSAISGTGSPQFQITDCNSTVIQPWGAASQSIAANQCVQLRLTSNVTVGNTNTASLTIGPNMISWSVTTANTLAVFVTSTTYPTNLGSVAAYDAACNTQAAAAGLTGYFKSWTGITSGIDDPATTFTRSTIPWVNMGGPTIANNWTGLTGSNLLHSISLTENGTAMGGDALTGLSSNGVASGGPGDGNCNGWTRTDSAYLITNGWIAGPVNSGWSSYYVDYGCTSINTFHLYCFEQGGTTPTKLTFAAGSTTNFPINTCSGPFIVQSSDASGFPANVPADTAVTLSENGAGTGTFYTDSSCGTAPVTQVTIPNGQNRATFYMTHTATETMTLTGVGGGYTNGTLSVTVGPNITCGYASTGAKCIFVTSATYNGNLGGVAGANTKCNTVASAAFLPGTYKAWIATTSGGDDPSVTFTQASVPYKLVDGTTIANNWTDLADGTIAAAINKTEAGAAAAASTWTNVSLNPVTATTSGSSTTGNCSAWSSSNSGRSANVGSTSSATSTWSNAGSTSACNLTLPLYCVQQ